MNENEVNYKIGSWTLTDMIYNNDKTIIYEVVIDEMDMNISKEDIKELTSKRWILKGSKVDSLEIEIIDKLKLNESDLIPCMPTNPYYRYGYKNKCGKYNIQSWMTMEKYDTTINKQLSYCYYNVFNLALYLINFIEWLHIEKKSIYGDMKFENIVVNLTENKFSVIDFESIDKPLDIVCCDNLPDGYYYYALGCEYDKEYYSYRMDLQAIGYILCYVLENTDRETEWVDRAYKYYNRRTTKRYFFRLNNMRDEHNKSIPRIIKYYFDIISSLEWNAKVSKPEIYTKLKRLFEW
jgi:hypothetical protein